MTHWEWLLNEWRKEAARSAAYIRKQREAA